MNFFFHKISRFFIPHEENNYHAQSLHTSMLSVYLLIAVILVFTTKNIPQFANVLGVATDISITKLSTLTNEQRAKYNLPILKLNSTLSAAAEKKAEDMFKNDYWAHFGPHGESPWDFIKQSGYQYEYAGENLAKNFLFSPNVVDAWMNSPTHKENIVKKEYTEVGYAVKNGMLNGEETTLVVQMFGTPLIKQIEQTDKQVEKQHNIPLVVNQEKKPAILGQQNQGAVVNGKRFAYNINIIFIAFIALALILDFAFASQLNILHLRGKHIAHLLFLGFISLGIVFILKQGAIL